MLSLCLRYVWKYGMDIEAVVTTLQGLLQMVLTQQPHHPEVALAQQHRQQEVALVQKHHMWEVALVPPVSPVTRVPLTTKYVKIWSLREDGESDASVGEIGLLREEEDGEA